jgi:predicted unusual protein kinase regulating ubiquinone biosynthesis (AarF/ABC1/UbiB family)
MIKIPRKLNIIKTLVKLNFKIATNTLNGRWLADELTTLGPTCIKIGQFISSRSDIFGESFASEFNSLRDQIPPMCVDQSTKILDEMLNSYDALKEVQYVPIATASIGQVHRAKGKNGNEIVIKIKRDNIEKMVDDDIAFLKRLGNILMFFKVENVDATMEMLVDFESFIKQEISFTNEMNNLVEFYSTYQKTYSDFVVIPRVVKELCSNDVIVMEYIHNIGLDNFKGDKKEFAAKIMTFFIRQLVEFGYIQADPHGANIGVSLDNKLIIYDFGNMLRISENDRHLLKEMLYLLIVGNNKGVAKVLGELGVDILDDDAVAKYVDRYTQYMKTIDINVFKGMYAPTDKLPILLNGKIVRILRVYGILEGICKQLDPDFNYFKLIDVSMLDLVVDEGFMQYKMKKDMNSLFGENNKSS